MHPIKRINAAMLAATVLFAFCCTPISRAFAAAPIMAAPFQLDARAQAAVIAQLGARRNAVGLDTDHGYQLQSQHPGT